MNMDNYLADVKQMHLFSGIEQEHIFPLLDCLHAQILCFTEGEMIIEEGDQVSNFGVLLSGHARSMKWDSTGRIILLSMLEKGSEIGVLLAAQPKKKSPVYVQALDDAAVLMIPFEHILSPCHNACPSHNRILKNYLSCIAEKGLMLHERINCLLKPTVREKIMTYLLRVSQEQKSVSFRISLNRNEMAEYLNIERSALSRELSNMKKDGLIDYHMDSFTLLAISAIFSST